MPFRFRRFQHRAIFVMSMLGFGLGVKSIPWPLKGQFSFWEIAQDTLLSLATGVILAVLAYIFYRYRFKSGVASSERIDLISPKKYGHVSLVLFWEFVIGFGAGFATMILVWIMFYGIKIFW